MTKREGLWLAAIILPTSLFVALAIFEAGVKFERSQCVGARPPTSSASATAPAPEPDWRKQKYARDVRFAECVAKHGIPAPGFDRGDEWGLVCIDENSVLPIDGQKR